MVRVLITGVGGFVGRHLFHHLLSARPEAEIHGTILPGLPALEQPNIICHALDLRDPQAVQSLLEAVQPEHIYHLAAQASPRRSFAQPWETLENNIRGQLNLIEACLRLNLRPRFLVISSAEVYGNVPPDHLPLREETQLRPTNPYGVSKAAQDILGLQYFLSHKLPILRARPFNHFGPGQSEGFVAPDFAMQVARIEAGRQPPVIQVGNLSAQRDFTDVRDVVRAYSLLMESGTAGEAYNIASGNIYSIQELLDQLLRMSRVAIEVRSDPARMMPIDTPIIRGDATRLRAATGWQPSIRFEQTLQDVLDDCRERVRQQTGRADCG